jgi:ketosteroid isomerase-like protein
MAQENMEMVRREYAAFDGRDWASLAEIWHPDVEYETLEFDPDSGIYRGLDDITRFFDAWAEPYSEFRVQADEILDVGSNQVPANALRAVWVVAKHGFSTPGFA